MSTPDAGWLGSALLLLLLVAGIVVGLAVNGAFR